MKKSLIISLIFIQSFHTLLAWPGGSGTGSGSSGGPGFNSMSGTDNATNNSDTPVDGGIIGITALAIGYGVRQARKRKEEKNNDTGAV